MEETLLSEYEIIVIIRADLEESDIMTTYGRVCQSVAELGGHVLDKEDWGRRKLAYPIKKFSYGRYMMAVALLNPKDVKEIERRMRFDDRLVRFLVVCVGPVNDPTARIEQAEERRKNGPDIRRRSDLEEIEEPAEEDYDIDHSAID